jgi:hypothetical protein
MMNPVPLEVIDMYCEVHELPKTMDCEICGTPLCRKCAEFVEGGWLCHACARKERHSVLVRFDPHYRELVAGGDVSTALLEE